MIGQKFGKLTVTSLSDVRKHGQKTYVCICNCGSTSVVLGANLRKGNSTSCGCTRKDSCSKRMSNLNFRHGETGSKLWRTWKGVVERTTIPTSAHYGRYGALGIGIHHEWLIYENFAAYMGQPPSSYHSIDRIDNSQGYVPGNVRWATAKEQASNRSTSIFVLVDGNSVTLSDAARILNISKSTASRWYSQGKLTPCTVKT